MGITKVSYDKENHVTHVYIDYKCRENTSIQKFLLSSDRHWDNPKSDRKLQKEHLEEAKSCNAGIIDVGDLFCAMQGKYDKRSNKNDVLPEHNNDHYLDSLVDTATEWFAPYAKNFILIGDGNHESSIANRHETNLITRLLKGLHGINPSIANGSYSGFVVFHFSTTNSTGTKSQHDSVTLYYHHGAGGSAPVTKGILNAPRVGLVFPDADICISGHIHEHWVFPITRQRINQRGTTYFDTQYHVKLPTYKEEYGKGKTSYHIIEGRHPKPIGAVWLDFYYKNGKIGIELTKTR